jgi:hypothetical protein
MVSLMYSGYHQGTQFSIEYLWSRNRQPAKERIPGNSFVDVKFLGNDRVWWTRRENK